MITITHRRFGGLALAALAACAGGGGTAEPEPQARVTVENRSSLDMDVYVRRQSGQQSRLGFAPAGESTSFALPTGLLAGAGTVRLEARPTRGSGRPVYSDALTVRRGAEIVWSIPPQ